MRTAKLKSWQGRTDNSMPPESVRERLCRKQGDRCAHCGRPFGPKEARANCDHIVPLRDGGANVEDNLQMLCNWCHVEKTSAEATSRAKTRRIRAKRFGLDQVKSNRWRGAGFPVAEPQRRASTKTRGKFAGDIMGKLETV